LPRNKFADNYSWGLWTWPQGQDGKRTNFDSTDGFGAYEVLPLSTWSGVSSLNYIVSTANWNKDPGPNESFNFADYTVDSVGNVVVFKMTGTSGVYKTATEAFAAGGSTSSSSASSGGSSSTTSYRPGSTITSISYPSTSVSHPAEWYNKWAIDETGETRNTLPTTSANAKSYNDFKLWNEYPSDYWKIISPYTGTRKDFRDEQIYFCITTRFYNGDRTNDARCWDQNASTDYYDPPWRGDFKGLIEKMDYIKALGFTSIWITPVVENTSGLDYHGYHASNFNKVDPRYESTDVDFQKVITEAHKRDMKIVLDVVWNHTGNFGEMGLCPMFSKKGDLSYFNCEQVRADSGLPSTYNTDAGSKQYDERLAMMKNTDGVNHDVNYYYHHYGNFSWENWGEQMAQIAGDCVDLNTENPVVAEYLVRCYGQFIRMGVDAFRVDTMKQISRLTLNKFYIGAFQKFAEKCGNPNFFMYGEVCARAEEAWNHGVPAVSAPFYTWAESKDYDWGTSIDGNIAATETAFKDAADTNAQPTSTNAFLSSGYVYHAPDHSKASGTSVIDFPMHWAFCNATHAYQNCASVDKYFNDCTYNVVYVNSHDYSPNGRCDMMPDYNVPTWCEDFDLMYTFRGIPCMYYGTEVQFQAGKVIDQGGNSALSNTGRAYFGEHLEGSVTTTGFGSYSAASGNLKDTLASTISQHLMKLSKIRQAVPALRYGQYTACTNNNMAFVKRYTSGSIDSVAAVAISSSYNFTGLPDGTYVDVVSGATKVVSGGTLSVSGLSQAKMAVYVLQNASSGTLSKIGGSTTYLA
jgi:glycosidase